MFTDTTMELIKYNFGCGPKYLEGYLNVDSFAWDKVDIIHDLSSIPYFFAENNSASDILAIEVLEHLGFKYIPTVLAEWYRILAPNGILHLQVPDCGKMMEYYVNDQICECVPHKDPTGKFLAKQGCTQCHGIGKVNPLRWLYAFTGAQKHPFDTHKSIFTNENLYNVLVEVGFKDLHFTDDINKLKVDALKMV
jgi:hypothetical protein